MFCLHFIVADLIKLFHGLSEHDSVLNLLADLDQADFEQDYR